MAGIILTLNVFLLPLALAGSGEYMTWMTPYNTAENINWDDVLSNVPSTCSLVHVHMIARHGSRTPSTDQITAANAVVAKVANLVKSNPGAPDLLKNLANWTAKFPSGGQVLLPLGEAEHRFLGVNFINLFAKYQLTGTLMFNSTSVSRTINSYKAFSGQWKAPFVLLPNVPDDKVLSFFTMCDSYVTKIKTNVSTRPEFTKIDKSPEAILLVQDFNDRLLGNGNTYNISFNFADIFNLYYMLGYEQLTNVESVLGQIFEDSDLQFFDYADDVETWWKSAYGYPLNYQITCSLDQNIFKLANDPIKYAGVFDFAHSETLAAVYAAFGLFNDTQPLTANATRDFIGNRLFKCSEITPFAANIAFLFFDCPSNSDSSMAQRQLAVLVNGKIVRLPAACPDNDICPLDKVKSTYSWMSTCDQAQICQL